MPNSTEIIDAKILAFLAGRPWLKVVFTLLSALLGVAKSRHYFQKKYDIR